MFSHYATYKIEFEYQGKTYRTTADKFYISSYKPPDFFRIKGKYCKTSMFIPIAQVGARLNVKRPWMMTLSR